MATSLWASADRSPEGTCKAGYDDLIISSWCFSFFFISIMSRKRKITEVQFVVWSCRRWFGQPLGTLDGPWVPQPCPKLQKEERISVHVSKSFSSPWRFLCKKKKREKKKDLSLHLTRVYSSQKAPCLSRGRGWKPCGALKCIFISNFATHNPNVLCKRNQNRALLWQCWPIQGNILVKELKKQNKTKSICGI